MMVIRTGYEGGDIAERILFTAFEGFSIKMLTIFILKNITVTVFVYFVFSNMSNNESGFTFSTIIVQLINKREHHFNLRISNAPSAVKYYINCKLYKMRLLFLLCFLQLIVLDSM